MLVVLVGLVGERAAVGEVAGELGGIVAVAADWATEAEQEAGMVRAAGWERVVGMAERVVCSGTRSLEGGCTVAHSRGYYIEGMSHPG